MKLFQDSLKYGSSEKKENLEKKNREMENQEMKTFQEWQMSLYDYTRTSLLSI